MKYCKECGVELGNSMEICPLCMEPASIADDNPPIIEISGLKTKRNIDTFSTEENSVKQKFDILRKLTSFILLSSIMVTMCVDLISSHTITWSKYTIASCAILYININLLRFFKQSIFISITVGFILLISLFLLFGTELYNVKWSVGLAIPLLILMYISFLAIYYISGIIKEKGINLIGYYFIYFGFINLGIEYCIDRYLSDIFIPGWSLYVTTSTFLIAVILLFVHYKLKKGTELKRLFHF